MESTKNCRVCRRNLPLTQFHKNRKSRNGRVNLCKECASIQGAAYRTAHKQEINRRTNERIAANADLRERRYAKLKQWQSDNPDRYKYHQIKLSAKKKNWLFDLSLEQFRDLFWEHPCFYCGQPSLGGIDRVDNKLGYTINNCVPCCWSCNKIKSSKTIGELKENLVRLSAILDKLEHHRSPISSPPAAPGSPP